MYSKAVKTPNLEVSQTCKDIRKEGAFCAVLSFLVFPNHLPLAMYRQATALDGLRWLGLGVGILIWVKSRYM